MTASDVNPIEMAFSKVRAFLNATAEAIELFTRRNAKTTLPLPDVTANDRAPFQQPRPNDRVGSRR